MIALLFTIFVLTAQSIQLDRLTQAKTRLSLRNYLNIESLASLSGIMEKDIIEARAAVYLAIKAREEWA